MFVFKEASFQNKDLYFGFNEDKIPTTKVAILDRNAPEHVLQEIFKESITRIDDFNMLKEFKPQYSMPGDSIADNTNIRSIVDILVELERLNTMQYENNENYMCFLYPGIMVYELENLAVKVPKQYMYRDMTFSWDYEYLITPNGDLNPDLYNLLNDEYQSKFGKRLGDLGDLLDRVSYYGQFSPNYYELKRQEFITFSIKVKAVINAIRLNEYSHKIDSKYYDIFQESRMAKKDKIAHRVLKYKGFYKDEISINEYAKGLGYTLEELNHIAYVEDTCKEFLSKFEDDPAMEPLVLYVKMLVADSTVVMNLYEELEKQRNDLRRQIYMLNLTVFKDGEGLADYINLLKSNYDGFYIPGEYEWVLGKEKISYTVKLEFKHKKVSKEAF